MIIDENKLRQFSALMADLCIDDDFRVTDWAGQEVWNPLDDSSQALYLMGMARLKVDCSDFGTIIVRSEDFNDFKQTVEYEDNGEDMEAAIRLAITCSAALIVMNHLAPTMAQLAGKVRKSD